MTTKRTTASLIGALLVAASGAIHLRLWLEGYRALPTIGPLFLAQALTAFVLAAGVATIRRRTVMAAAAVFLLGTAAGYLVDVAVGLFGFRDTLANGWGQASLVVEGVGTLVLAAGAWGPAGRRPSRPHPGRHNRAGAAPAGRRPGWPRARTDQFMAPG